MHDLALVALLLSVFSLCLRISLRISLRMGLLDSGLGIRWLGRAFLLVCFAFDCV